MSTKALKKQLMAAIAMVLVAAVALGSSTYAWFANNNTVTAKEMNVQAVAESGIEIREISSTSDSDWSSVDAAAVTTAMTLYPTSTYDGTTWAHASATAASAATAKAGSYEMLSLTKGDGNNGTLTSQYYAGGKQYYRVDQFNIRAVKGTTTAQKVGVKSVTVTGTPAALDKSLRVLVVGADGQALYNAGAGDSTRNVCASVNASKNPETIAAVTYLANGDASDLIATCAAGTQDAAGAAQTVSIYLYYEGEETQHYSNNLTSALAGLSVTVEFVSDDTLTTATAITPAAASDAQKAGTASIN